jgi:hypothetical protein
MIDEKQFKERFGSEPMDDDLERVNCSEVGDIGHCSCGVCEKHNKPRFMCGCLGPLK